MRYATAHRRLTAHSRPGRVARRLVVVGLIASTLSACGSSGKSSTVTGASTGGPDITQADRLVSLAEGSALTGPSFGPVTASQAVKWTVSQMPTPSALPKAHLRVDVVYGIPTGAAPYTAHVIKAVGDKLGWDVTVLPASAQTQQAALQDFQEALLNKPNAIIAVVTPGVWVGQALATAKSEGIATVDISQDETTGPGYDAWVPDAEGIQKSLLGAFAVKESAGKANSILFDAPGFSDADIPAAQAYLDTCGGCKTAIKQINPTDFTDPVTAAGDVSAELQANPDATYLMWPDGSLPIESVLSAIQSSANPDVKLLVNGPAPQGFQLIQSGMLPGAVDSPEALLALIGIDEVSRLAQHEQPLAQAALRVPVRLFTKANLPDAANYSTLTRSIVSEDDYLAPYDKAWGTNLESTILSVTS